MLTTNCQTIFEVSVLISELSNLSSEIIFYQAAINAFNPCFMNLQKFILLSSVRNTVQYLISASNIAVLVTKLQAYM